MIDKGLYWSLQEGETAPTKKIIKYVDIVYPNTSMKLAVGVYEGLKYTEINKEELDWHIKQGAKIETYTNTNSTIKRC